MAEANLVDGQTLFEISSTDETAVSSDEMMYSVGCT